MSEGINTDGLDAACTLAILHDSFAEEIERTLKHRANPSPGGQQAGSFNGDLAGCNITSLHRLQWWLREFVRHTKAMIERQAQAELLLREIQEFPNSFDEISDRISKFLDGEAS